MRPSQLDRRPALERIWDGYFHRSILAVIIVLGPVEAFVIALILHFAGIIR